MRKRTKTLEAKLNDSRVEFGSGNVFADLGFDNSEELLAKARLIFEIQKTIKRKKLTQTAAAELLGLTQPKLSVLLKGNFNGYSTDRLIRFLRVLGHNIDIIVSDKLQKSKAHLNVYSYSERMSCPIAAEPSQSRYDTTDFPSNKHLD